MLIELALPRGRMLRGMADTGCTLTLISCRAANRLGLKRRPQPIRIQTIEGRQVTTLGKVVLDSVSIAGRRLQHVSAHVVETLPPGLDVIVGMDTIPTVGLNVRTVHGRARVTIGGDDQVARKQPPASQAVASSRAKREGHRLRIEEPDFLVVFDGQQWTVRWKWKSEPPTQSLAVNNYRVYPESQELFDKEVQSWVEDGILVPWNREKHGPVEMIIPLMAKAEPRKGRVRPVMDYRRFNEHIVSRPGGEAAVCAEKMRDWRQKGSQCEIVDLRKAYLQIRVADDLLRYQAVRFRGKTYVMTRMGFGLSIGPKVMTAVLQKVLSLDKNILAASDSYIDDILLQGDRDDAERTRGLLQRWGLQTKQPISLSGARVLGLRVTQGREGKLVWKRDGPVPEPPPERCTRRDLYSICGELLGHFPVAGWLRVACGFLKRRTTGKWDDFVDPDSRAMLAELVQRTCREDPAQGIWLMDRNQPVRLWCDASNIATGVAIAVDGEIVEDAAWLRKKDDTAHINVSELDAVIRGINLCLKWGIRQLTVMTDSSTVAGWLKAVLDNAHRIRTHALSEMLIRRRLDLLRELVRQEGMEITVEKVRSSDNKADSLTRVPKRWLGANASCDAAALVGAAVNDVTEAIRRIHDIHHLGVDRTWELARIRLGEQISKRMVRRVVNGCRRCKQVDPAVNFRWDSGDLSDGHIWRRLAIDITYLKGQAYLSVIDSGSRFTIWKALRNESAATVTAAILEVFAEFGPPEEILSDNGTAFRSATFRHLLASWGVRQEFACAYRSVGNSLAERGHRTIKRMVARSGRSVHEMAFWYNNTRASKQEATPFELVFATKPRLPGVRVNREDIVRPQLFDQGKTNASRQRRRDASRNPFSIGDAVFMKESKSCVKPWSGPWIVSRVLSNVAVELNHDGIPRHVSHLRRVPDNPAPEASQSTPRVWAPPSNDCRPELNRTECGAPPLRQGSTDPLAERQDTAEPCTQPESGGHSSDRSLEQVAEPCIDGPASRTRSQMNTVPGDYFRDCYYEHHED